MIAIRKVLILISSPRQDGQGTREEYRSKDFRGDLEERERIALKERTKERARRFIFINFK